MQRSFLQKVQIHIIGAITKVRWKPRRNLLNEDDNKEIKEKLKIDYYIIATRRRYLLTTFFIDLSHFLLTGRWGYYTHVLMNLEDTVKDDDDFIFIEATTHGTRVSSFSEVFGDINAVAFIKPKNMTIDEWTATLDRALVYKGVPYDNLFDLKSDLEINCVELVRLALQVLPDYNTKFAEFEKLIAKKKKLTPQMFAECSDFEIVFEIKRG